MKDMHVKFVKVPIALSLGQILSATRPSCPDLVDLTGRGASSLRRPWSYSGLLFPGSLAEIQRPRSTRRRHISYDLPVYLHMWLRTSTATRPLCLRWPKRNGPYGVLSSVWLVSSKAMQKADLARFGHPNRALLMLKFASSAVFGFARFEGWETIRPMLHLQRSFYPTLMAYWGRPPRSEWLALRS